MRRFKRRLLSGVEPAILHANADRELDWSRRERKWEWEWGICELRVRVLQENGRKMFRRRDEGQCCLNTRINSVCPIPFKLFAISNL